MPNAPLLVIDDLHASAEGTEILKGVSLTVERDQVQALMGPNGSGKSTLARLIVGLEAPNSGSIEYEGIDFLKKEIGRAHV